MFQFMKSHTTHSSFINHKPTTVSIEKWMPATGTIKHQGLSEHLEWLKQIMPVYYPRLLWRKVNWRWICTTLTWKQRSAPDLDRRLNALVDALNCDTLSKPVLEQLTSLTQGNTIGTLLIMYFQIWCFLTSDEGSWPTRWVGHSCWPLHTWTSTDNITTWMPAIRQIIMELWSQNKSLAVFFKNRRRDCVRSSIYFLVIDIGTMVKKAIKCYQVLNEVYYENVLNQAGKNQLYPLFGGYTSQNYYIWKKYGILSHNDIWADWSLSIFDPFCNTQ